MKKNLVRAPIVLTLLIVITVITPMGVLAEFTPFNGQPAVLVLGQLSFNEDTSSTNQNGMDYPASVAVDPVTGKVFVADGDNHRVLRFASVTALDNKEDAEAVLGQANFNSGDSNRGGVVAANSMDYPSGVFVDSSGRLWVADRNNHRVLRFDSAANKVNGANADGVLGQAGFDHGDANRGGEVGAGTLNSPLGVFVDKAGILWVSDFLNHRVLRFDDAATKPNGDIANGVLGQPGFDSNTPATSQSGMAGPSGLFVDSEGVLWVTDYVNNRTLRFTGASEKPDGAKANGVLGQSNFTSSGFACTQSGMYYPWGVSGDSDGRLYVADSSNNRVLIFKNAASLWYGSPADNVLGQSFFTTCTDGVTSMKLDAPGGIFFDSVARVLWLADRDNNRVLLYGNTGETATLVLGQADFTSYSPATTDTGLNQPVSVAVDPTTGKVFVADCYNNRVLRYASVTALSNGAAAEAVLGQADFEQDDANRGGAVTANTMYEPIGLFVDSAGILWVSDTYNNRVLGFNSASTKTSGANAERVLGQTNFSNYATATSQSGMNYPTGLFVDSGSRLWLSDSMNHRVLRFDDVVHIADGGNASRVLGQEDFDDNLTNRGAIQSANGMAYPAGLFVDSAGRLWVSDTGNIRILRFDRAVDKINGADADGVLGQQYFTDVTMGCKQSKMGCPIWVSGDNAG